MAVNLMGEFNLLIQVDRRVTYSDLEDAITTAGFTDYAIVRQLGENTTDVQVTVRNNEGVLDAADTLSSFATAVAGLDSGAGGGEGAGA